MNIAIDGHAREVVHSGLLGVRDTASEEKRLWLGKFVFLKREVKIPMLSPGSSFVKGPLAANEDCRPTGVLFHVSD